MSYFDGPTFPLHCPIGHHRGLRVGDYYVHCEYCQVIWTLEEFNALWSGSVKAAAAAPPLLSP